MKVTIATSYPGGGQSILHMKEVVAMVLQLSMNVIFVKKCLNILIIDILKNEPPSFVQDLSEWLPQEGNWSVCWKATRDGWNVRNFHSHCDNWEPTLTIVKVMKNNKTLIFGGYATKSWAHKGRFIQAKWYTPVISNTVISSNTARNLTYTF